MLIGNADTAKRVMLGGTIKPLLGMTKLCVDGGFLKLAEPEAA